jgi:hypothetical protein
MTLVVPSERDGGKVQVHTPSSTSSTATYSPASGVATNTGALFHEIQPLSPTRRISRWPGESIGGTRVWQRSARWLVATRRLVAQGFVWPLLVVFADEAAEGYLLIVTLTNCCARSGCTVRCALCDNSSGSLCLENRSNLMPQFRHAVDNVPNKGSRGLSRAASHR